MGPIPAAFTLADCDRSLAQAREGRVEEHELLS